MSIEAAKPREVLILENRGFKEAELLKFIEDYPREAGILFMQSLLFKQDNNYIFPSMPTKEEEDASAEKADQGFRARDGRHSVAVGFTFNLLLTSLLESGKIPMSNYTIHNGTGAMSLHDIKKLEEMRGRAIYGSSDIAYDKAEIYLADILHNAGFAPEFAQLAGSIGHNGAKDFITSPEMWTIIRQCAYLADDLLQETVIQSDILAKVHRLQTQPRYVEANNAGFPDRLGHPDFTKSDGTLRKKYDVQKEATIQMARNVSELLGIEWQDLGKYLIQKATEKKIYQATFS